MRDARTVLPTDLVALVSFDGRIYPNEAKTWDRLGLHERGPHPLETALEQWFSFATGKHTWISVRGPAIRGLVSARPRARRSAWEVDCLINADEDTAVCLGLLERMGRDISRAGAQRVFLRLNADSPLCPVVCQAGFFPYGRERLFRCDAPLKVEAPDLPLRPPSKADAWGLFRFYNSLVPATVRSIEGPTLRDWLAAQERCPGRVQDWLLDEDGAISAWLRLGGGTEGRFRLLHRPGSGQVEALVRAALARLAGKQPLLCLLPTYAEELATALLKWGFQPVGQYVLLAKRLLRVATEMAPEEVGQAVPVS